ncbi:putative delta-1-pyrroline-5-carboxylate dehydrogenase [Leishmania major strain Friedlin]|uniref:Multifunctional fusion protein n=1 Tax=Leishmania major TaxID=5664 RepID=E9ACG7_LEIMA|nr:putative delta-1-pyrroline-5-carboxylate dehydrogenase [Leishmania major strain Friedlin]CAG9567246.1 delta-1-pyrroline-5-carboxylate_dehydrogenase_-_putative [Leishmania major strain Friedlin]CBZ11983.1 putative delta-1-pyrroline-5-carboxylate dehydrogenase [Leishmania major strain Friedlin]|eukprot:XP_003721698.1 putative delta-1-pyrroline-5-carboxylate dehydrogenase [Leishmania major strain Friedlin]
MLRRTVSCAFAAFKCPPVLNEPMDNFEPGSVSAKGTLEACKEARGEVRECPIMIGGKPYTSSNIIKATMPSDHQVQIAKAYNATPELAKKAVEAAVEASKEWSQVPFRDRAAIFYKAAHLLSTKYRHEMRAVTMLGQSKNPWQAEIDCVAEACDFIRWNIHFAEELYAQQPRSVSNSGVWNTTDYRPLEGFVSAITPFNFTAIAANLAGTPALMGNTVVWKPSPTAVLSNYLMYKIMEEAGLPAGVINFVPCEPAVMDSAVNADPRLAAVVFTGSTRVFTEINKNVFSRLETYHNFPRISGETGGKDFHLVHPSADVRHVAAGTVRGAFEFQGQKCSACSRLYAPQSCWKELKALLIKGQKQVKMGQPDDFQSFMCAVIDETSFNKNKKYIEIAKADSSNYEIVAGGKCDKTRGYFVEPTIIETKDPRAQLMREEIFGPVLTVFVYDDSKPGYWKEVCELVDSTTKYGLTGAVFSRERAPIREADKYLRYAAGNYYVNDKCTGAVVGQQPFGGSRLSGSNDKPGAGQFVTRFVSARSIKESFDVTPTISYPHQLPDVYTL